MIPYVCEGSYTYCTFEKSHEMFLPLFAQHLRVIIKKPGADSRVSLQLCSVSFQFL